MYEFITNNFEISNEKVALIYKIRWQIELFFKKLKQNFQLHYFYSETENGIKTQIWITLVAQFFDGFENEIYNEKSFLISNLQVFWVIEKSRRTYSAKKN
jgi:transposase